MTGQPDRELLSDGGAIRGRRRLRVPPGAVAGKALTFTRLSPFVRPALVNGAAGVVVAPRGRPLSVVGFTVSGGKWDESGGTRVVGAAADPVLLVPQPATMLLQPRP